MICLDYGIRISRAALQEELAALNPSWLTSLGLKSSRRWRAAPDGDAGLEETALKETALKEIDYAGFRIKDCARCGGILKPDVVLFGENVPRQRVEHARRCLAQCDALLVIGSSLIVFSGYRLARAAGAAGTALFIINQSKTRADELALAKVEIPAAIALDYLV